MTEEKIQRSLEIKEKLDSLKAILGEFKNFVDTKWEHSGTHRNKDNFFHLYKGAVDNKIQDAYIANMNELIYKLQKEFDEL